MLKEVRLGLSGLFAIAIVTGLFCVNVLAADGLPADTPAQAKARKALNGKGYIYVPEKNQLSRINVDGSDLRVLWKSENARDKITLCQVSWDGLSLAFVVSPAKTSGPSGEQDLWMMKYDGTDPKKILHRSYSSWFKKLYCAWTPDSAWLVVANGTKIDAVNRKTGKLKAVMQIKVANEAKSGLGYLSSDLHGNFYYWSQKIKGNAFSLDKDCNVVRDVFNCGMNTACQPRISPDGMLMARHDHDYEWNDSRKRGYITEKPAGGEKTSYKRYFLPKNEDMPLKGTHNMPFWSPDSAYIGFVYFPDADLMEENGFEAPKKFSVLVVSARAGGPMVWLMPVKGQFPSWGPVPK